METPLELAESQLIDLEKELNNLKLQSESKQAERILSNHGWMTIVFEEKLIPKSKNFKDSLVKIKNSYGNSFKMTTQFDAPLAHCDEIHKLLNELLYLYKIRANSIDLKLKFNNNIPKIMNNFNSLRNRFYIVKGNVSRTNKVDEEDFSFQPLPLRR